MNLVLGGCGGDSHPAASPPPAQTGSAPDITTQPSNVTVGQGLVIAANGDRQPVATLNVTIAAPLDEAARQRIGDWFKARTKAPAVSVNIKAEPPPARPGRKRR